MVTFDIELAVSSFTELLSEELVGDGTVENVHYPMWGEPTVMRLTLVETPWDTWMEVKATDEGLEGTLVEGDRQSRIIIDQYTDCYQQLVKIKKLWEQFLKA